MLAKRLEKAMVKNEDKFIHCNISVIKHSFSRIILKNARMKSIRMVQNFKRIQRYTARRRRSKIILQVGIGRS